MKKLDFEERKLQKRSERLKVDARKNMAQAGITLVALVVTIVVLLILAGVTITYVFSDNGILSQAQSASTETDIATTLEEMQQRLLTIQVGNEGKYTNDDVIDVVLAVTGNEVKERQIKSHAITTNCMAFHIANSHCSNLLFTSGFFFINFGSL